MEENEIVEKYSSKLLIFPVQTIRSEKHWQH